MSKSIRIDCTGFDGARDTRSMTGITIHFNDLETDFHAAKAKALGQIVEAFCRYGLHEALNGIGILDDHGKRMRAEAEEFRRRNSQSLG